MAGYACKPKKMAGGGLSGPVMKKVGRNMAKAQLMGAKKKPLPKKV